MHSSGCQLHACVRSLAAAGFLFLALQTMSQAQSYRISGVDFRVEDDVVVVRYDLESDRRRPKWFTVRLALSTAVDTLDLHPRSLSGDIGRVRPGRDKTIRWLVLDDYPTGLDLEEARFTVLVSPGGTFFDRLPRLVRIGAAAVLIGGTAVGAALLIRGKGYPEPPRRPTFQ